MEWIKKHADTVVVLGAIISSIAWMNVRFSQIDNELSIIKKQLSLIKAALLIKATKIEGTIWNGHNF